MSKEELKKEIIKKYSKHKSIFMTYKDDILYLKQNNVTLKGILEYLFQVDEDIKNKYQGKEKIALTNLSKFIKKQLNQNSQKKSLKPQLQQKENKTNKKTDEKINIPWRNAVDILNEDKNYIIDESYRDLI